MNKSSLLEHIRTFRHQVMCELDRLEDAILSLEDTLPGQNVQVHNDSSDDWLTAGEVCKALKIAQSTLYSQIKSGGLPDGIAFGPCSKRWKLSEIRDWLARKNSQTMLVRKKGRTSRVRNISEFC